MPSNFLKPFYSSDPLKAKKFREANFKKMKRRLIKQYGDRWKERWEENKKLLKNIEKGESVQFGYPPPEVIGNPYGRFELRNPVTGKLWVKPKPINLRILSFVWLTKSYFERLTKAKMGKPHPCWNLIAELVNTISDTDSDYTTMDLASWWGKSKKYFDPWDGDVFLESNWQFYQRHKPELDKQCEDWIEKCIEKYADNEKEADRGFQEEIEKWREFL